MPSLPFFQYDSFADRTFAGNPAAVCLMQVYESDDVLQAIALENNLSETAFVAPSDDPAADYDLRWFTPAVEVDLCGHATLAAGAALLEHVHVDDDVVHFKAACGIIEFSKLGAGRYGFNFPKLMAERVDMIPSLVDAIGVTPKALLQKDRDYLIVFDDQAVIRSLTPDLDKLRQHAPYGFVCTSPGKGGDGEPDFVSRCFYPNHGIEEDPVTGSAHSLSAPYWAGVLNKSDLHARQLSARSGDLWIEVDDDHIVLSGCVVPVIKGEFMYDGEE